MRILWNLISFIIIIAIGFAIFLKVATKINVAYETMENKASLQPVILQYFK